MPSDTALRVTQPDPSEGPATGAHRQRVSAPADPGPDQGILPVPCGPPCPSSPLWRQPRRTGRPWMKPAPAWSRCSSPEGIPSGIHPLGIAGGIEDIDYPSVNRIQEDTSQRLTEKRLEARPALGRGPRVGREPVRPERRRALP